MIKTRRRANQNRPSPFPIPGDHRVERCAVSRPAERPAANAWRRRLNRTTGFWLGALLLGTGGCVFGASMPYQHPVGVVVSIAWWTIFFACFGMNIGALVGLCAERTPAPPSEE